MAERQRTKRLEHRFTDFKSVQEFTSPLWTADNESPFAKNCDVSTPGVLSKALGYTQVGSDTGTGAVKGVFVYEKEDGTSTLMKVQGSSLYKYASGSWSEVASGLSTGTDKVEGVNAFIDDEERLYFTGEHDEPVRYTTGTSTTAITSTYAKHIAYWNYRLYLANFKYGTDSYPYRVQFSPEGSDTLDRDNDYFDDMGAPVTALKVYGKKLYIFTDDEIAAYDGYSLSRIPGNYGTPSAESVVVARGRMFWYNRFGFWMYAGAELPTLISKPVRGIVSAITAPGSVSGGILSDERIVWSVGDVTYDETSYTNAGLIYDIDNNGWMFRDAQPFGLYTHEKSGGSIVPYAGSDSGIQVYQIDNGYGNDTSTEIVSEWQTKKFDAGSPQDIKNFYKVRVVFKPTGNSEYLTVKYRMDGTAAWSQIGGTNNNVDLSGSDDIDIVELDLPSQRQCKWIQFQITHSSAVGGFEIYDIQVEFDMYPH